jgi:hypothetical protein
MKVTTRLPLSIMLPRVGHSLWLSVAFTGAYEIESSPLDVYDSATVEALTLSMLTMRIERTSVGLAAAQVLTVVKYDVKVPASSRNWQDQVDKGKCQRPAARRTRARVFQGGRTHDEWQRRNAPPDQWACT